MHLYFWISLYILFALQIALIEQTAAANHNPCRLQQIWSWPKYSPADKWGTEPGNVKCSIKLVHVLTSFEWLEIYFSIDEYSRDPSTRHPNTGLMSGAITILIPGFEVWKLGSIHVGGGLLSENWFSIQIPFKLPTIQWLDRIFCNTQLLWGSEYQTSLVFECLKVVQLPKSQFFKCNLNTGLNLPRYRQPFKY